MRTIDLLEIFEIGREVATYSSKEGAAELVSYYSDHLEEGAAQIARADSLATYAHILITAHAAASALLEPAY